MVILIDVDSYNNDLTLYYTDDHSILVQDNTIRYGVGMYYIDAKYLSTIEEIYDMYEDELADWNILSVEEVTVLAAEAKRKNELKRKDHNKQERYKEYLKLKEEFEMEDYK